jgi:nicotinate-nucleotide pyrophosphorylase
LVVASNRHQHKANLLQKQRGVLSGKEKKHWKYRVISEKEERKKKKTEGKKEKEKNCALVRELAMGCF